MLAATLFSIAPDLSRNRFLSLLSGLMAYYVTLALARSRRDVNRLLVAFAWLGGGIAIGGFLVADWNHAVILPATQPFYDALPRILLVMPSSGVPRATEFASARMIGGYLSILLPLCAGVILLGARRRGVLIIIAALMLFTMILTQTILAWGAAALALAALGVVGLRSRRVARGVGMALAAGAVAISLFLLTPGARQLGDSSIDLSERIFAHFDEIRLAAEITRDAPLVSNGLNTFPLLVTCFYQHPPERDSAFYPHTHNLFAQAAVDGGLIAMFAVTCLMLLLAGAPLLAAWAEPDRAWRITLAALGAAVVAYISYNLFEGLVLGNKLSIIFWAVFALGQAAATQSGLRARRLERALVVGFVVAALFVAGYGVLGGGLAQNIALVQARMLPQACAP